MAGFTSAVALTLGLGAQAVQWLSARRAAKADERVGELEQAAAEDTALLEEFNANVADLNAEDALTRGQEEAHRFRAGVRVLIGSQRAAQAASNIEVGFGSALDVEADAALLGKMDEITILNNAARESWGYRIEASDRRRRAAIVRKGGKYALEAGRVNASSRRIAAVGNILGAGASLLSSRYGFGGG